MFYRNRLHHWTCGKFADWVRGEKKPCALTLEEWDDWKEQQKKQRPIRFWLADTFLRKLQNFFCFPLDVYKNIRCYFRNRFIDKTHYLKTGLEPGNYYDLDHRILHGLFNELVEFVEYDCALMQDDRNKNYQFVKGRCIEAGLDYLDWASNLTYEDYGFNQEKESQVAKELTPQAKSAIEILKIYHWWKNRPNRKEPMEESGWSKICETKNPDPQEKDIAFNKLQELENQMDQEDEDMLISLIKIRKSLWT